MTLDCSDEEPPGTGLIDACDETLEDAATLELAALEAAEDAAEEADAEDAALDAADDDAGGGGAAELWDEKTVDEKELFAPMDVTLDEDTADEENAGGGAEEANAEETDDTLIVGALEETDETPSPVEEVEETEDTVKGGGAPAGADDTESAAEDEDPT